MMTFGVANYFWDCDRFLGYSLGHRIVRYFEHLFLTDWRYRRHVRTWKSKP